MEVVRVDAGDEAPVVIGFVRVRVVGAGPQFVHTVTAVVQPAGMAEGACVGQTVVV